MLCVFGLFCNDPSLPTIQVRWNIGVLPITLQTPTISTFSHPLLITDQLSSPTRTTKTFSPPTSTIFFKLIPSLAVFLNYRCFGNSYAAGVPVKIILSCIRSIGSQHWVRLSYSVVFTILNVRRGVVCPVHFWTRLFNFFGNSHIRIHFTQNPSSLTCSKEITQYHFRLMVLLHFRHRPPCRFFKM